MDRRKRTRGRPMKFGRPARAVTLTLPEDVIQRLSAVDADVARAVVAVVERRRLPRRGGTRPAEIARFGRHSVIVVPHVVGLGKLDGVTLVPIGDNRALIALDHPHSIPQLELDIRDALTRGDVARPARPTFEAIAEILQRARHSDALGIEERTIIVLEARRPRRTTAGAR